MAFTLQISKQETNLTHAWVSRVHARKLSDRIKCDRKLTERRNTEVNYLQIHRPQYTTRNERNFTTLLTY